MLVMVMEEKTDAGAFPEVQQTTEHPPMHNPDTDDDADTAAPVTGLAENGAEKTANQSL